MDRIKTYVGIAGYAIETAGVLVILVGSIVATAWFLQRARRVGLELAYQQFRIVLGRAILLGLEFLIAGDIIRTVVISHTVQSVLTLAVIVLVRTFLSLTIALEVEGRWPWQAREGTRQEI